MGFIVKDVIREMSGNRWHLKDEKKHNRTLCGRKPTSEGFSWSTARKVTDDVKVFRTNPCVFCLRNY